MRIHMHIIQLCRSPQESNEPSKSSRRSNDEKESSFLNKDVVGTSKSIRRLHN